MTIIIYGTSLLLDSLETALRQRGQFAALRLSAGLLPAPPARLPPGLIINDRQQTDAAGVGWLLAYYPGWPLLGLTGAAGYWLTRSEAGRAESLEAVAALAQEYAEGPSSPPTQRVPSQTHQPR